MDRNKIIKKLKDIKDPVQRDRIIWALEGKEKEVMHEKPAPKAPQKAVPTSAPERAQKVPQLPGSARKILNYIFPGIFIFFGFMNIVQAGLHYVQGEPEAAIPQFIMGLLFLLFGIFGIAKARKQVQNTGADQKKT